MRNLNGATVTCQAQNEIGMTSSKTQLDIKCEYNEKIAKFILSENDEIFVRNSKKNSKKLKTLKPRDFL